MLVMCAKEITFFAAVEKAKTEALHVGDAPLAWANPLKRFAPTTITSEIELTRDFAASRLGK